MNANNSSVSRANGVSGTQRGIYLVKTKGYKEQFDNKQKAIRVYDRIKSKKIANEETFKIELFTKESVSDNWQLLNESHIDKAFYN